MLLKELPIVFVSYDEPNADSNYRYLRESGFDRVSRVHGIKGFDAAHKVAAEVAYGMLDHQNFVTIDGDNQIIRASNVWSMDIQAIHKAAGVDPANSVVSFRAINEVNCACYGNGGVKVWSQDFANNMRTHEAATDGAVVDFCWQPGYVQMENVLSKTVPNASAQQAFRAGYREGVKLSSAHKFDMSPEEKLLHQSTGTPQVILTQWAFLGMDVPFGCWCIYGLAHGLNDAMANIDVTASLIDHENVNRRFALTCQMYQIPTDDPFVGETSRFTDALRATLSKPLYSGIIKTGAISSHRSEVIKQMLMLARTLNHELRRQGQ